MTFWTLADAFLRDPLARGQRALADDVEDRAVRLVQERRRGMRLVIIARGIPHTVC
jgi:hypothetical protein